MVLGSPYSIGHIRNNNVNEKRSIFCALCKIKKRLPKRKSGNTNIQYYTYPYIIIRAYGGHYISLNVCISCHDLVTK